MTDFISPRNRVNDGQDHVERGVWGHREEVPGAGSILRVRGTGTVDYEVPIVNGGYSFNLPADSNAEVIMMSLGSDVNEKVAIPTLPRNLQHSWGEGQGGVQHPTNPARRLEYNDNETWLKDGNYKLGDNKEVEVVVRNGSVTINIGPDAEIKVPNLKVTGNLTVEGDVKANGVIFEHNGVNVGDDHLHEGVDPGAGRTKGPVR